MTPTYTSVQKMCQNGVNMDAIATLLGYLLILTGTIWFITLYPWLIFAVGATLIGAKWLNGEPIGTSFIQKVKGLWQNQKET